MPISYFQRCLQQLMYKVQNNAVNTFDGLSCRHDLIGQYYHGDCLFRGFLRRCTQLKRAPVITGSFAVAEYLRCREQTPTWRPNAIDIFTDSAETFEWMIYLFNTTALNPLGLNYCMKRAWHYTSDDNREVFPRNSPVHSSRTEALNIKYVRQGINEMLHP